MATTVDVLVVGGGPAGSAAAIELGRAGISVLLADRAIFPRDKCCGDGLTTGALRRLETLGLKPSTLASWTWVDRVVLSTPQHRSIPFDLPTSGRFAATATRVELDHALLSLAHAAGADIREGHSLVALSNDHDVVRATLESSGGAPFDVEARYVIAADGMWSTTRKLLRGTSSDAGREKTYLGEWHGYRQYASGVYTADARDMWIWFERDIVPGYLWSFPLADGRVNVGFGIERNVDRPTKTMKSLWADLIARPHVRRVLGPDAVFEDAPKAWPIPADVSHAPLAAGRVLFVGDAARACDILTGEGIGQALQTGMAAAAAIVSTSANDRSGERAGKRYAEHTASDLVPDDRMASALQSLMSNRFVAEGAIRISGSSSWARRNFVRWLFEDYPRGIALTPSKWRWGLMSGDGAYPDQQE